MKEEEEEGDQPISCWIKCGISASGDNPWRQSVVKSLKHSFHCSTQKKECCTEVKSKYFFLQLSFWSFICPQCDDSTKTFPLICLPISWSNSNGGILFNFSLLSFFFVVKNHSKIANSKFKISKHVELWTITDNYHDHRRHCHLWYLQPSRTRLNAKDPFLPSEQHSMVAEYVPLSISSSLMSLSVFELAANR